MVEACLSHLHLHHRHYQTKIHVSPVWNCERREKEKKKKRRKKKRLKVVLFHHTFYIYIWYLLLFFLFFSLSPVISTAPSSSPLQKKYVSGCSFFFKERRGEKRKENVYQEWGKWIRETADTPLSSHSYSLKRTIRERKW